MCAVPQSGNSLRLEHSHATGAHRARTDCDIIHDVDTALDGNLCQILDALSQGVDQWLADSHQAWYKCGDIWACHLIPLTRPRSGQHYSVPPLLAGHAMLNPDIETNPDARRSHGEL